MGSVLWFRRDLRTEDHPALVRAAEDGPVLPLFVIDPELWRTAGPVRRAWVAANVLALADEIPLCIRSGARASVIGSVSGFGAVHVSRESTPYGVARDAALAGALGAGRWVETGTPYAVGPGLVTKGDGSAYSVFTPWAKAWRAHGWPAPAPSVDADWLAERSDPAAVDLLHAAVEASPVPLPPAGQKAARDRLAAFVRDDLADYPVLRDRPDLAGTSRLSPYLKVGAIHPRTVLAAVDAESVLATEIGWRDFYGDVLARRPDSAWADLRGDLAGLAYNDPGDGFEAWCQGRTGFPIVDAGMRQLNSSGWMHNRVRMIVASFLTKDLHAWWPAGARYFYDRLLDGDLASNSHGWQWAAGTGTDAAPYFRVFNPITQGQRFDPDGDYVRRWIPELAHLPGRSAHTPWDCVDGYSHGYPLRIVDHAEERRVALARYRAR